MEKVKLCLLKKKKLLFVDLGGAPDRVAAAHYIYSFRKRTDGKMKIENSLKKRQRKTDSFTQT